MKEKLFRCSFISFFLFASPACLDGQSFRDRLFWGFESSLNGDGYSTMFLTMSAESKIWLLNKFYMGLKYDRALGTFGNERAITSRINDSYIKKLQFPEPDYKDLSSLQLAGYLEFRFLKTKVFLKEGGCFLTKRTFKYTVRDDQGNVIQNIELGRKTKWGIVIGGGVKAENLIFGIEKNYSSIGNYTSLRVGYEFGNGKSLSKFHKPDNIKHLIPILMMDIGLEMAFNLKRGRNGAAIMSYIEPKIALMEQFSVGARFVFKENDYGTDKNPIHQFYPRDGETHLYRRESNALASTDAIIGVADWYFPQKNSWYYVGIGGGIYERAGEPGSKWQDDNGVEYNIPEIPAAKKPGIMLRCGNKTGIFRTGIVINITGKNVPDYMGFHIGFEPGIGAKLREKYLNKS